MGGALPHAFGGGIGGPASAPLDAGGGELLLGTCDALKVKWQNAPKEYRATLPRDVLWRFVLHGLVAAVAASVVFVLPLLLEPTQVPHNLEEGNASPGFFSGNGVGGALCACATLWLLVLLGQIPKRVVRQSDALVFEFLIYRYSVPLDDVLELVVLRKGSQFRKLLYRWGVFPYGRMLTCFFGARSSTGPVCVLLTRRCLWSFVVSLEDPVQFLLDNQRPLDMEATYRTTSRAALRDGEGLDSKRLATVPVGRQLKIEDQRGRRVLVRLEGGEDCGWMSYISQQGTSLLAKVRDDAVTVPAPGTVGASELAKSGDATALELGLLPPGRAAGIE